MMQLKTWTSSYRWLLLAAAVALAGCTSFPAPISQTQGTAAHAATLAQRGEHAQAAAAYEALAASRTAPEQADLQLTAAREWLAAGRPADAARVLGLVTAPASGTQAYERALLQAEVSLASHRAQLARQQIDALAATVPPGGALRYQSLRMRIALAAGRPIDGIRAEIAAERAAPNPADQLQLRRQLLAALLDARQRGVALVGPSGTDPTVSGWLELGTMAAQSRVAPLTSAALAARWRAQFPNHPAAAILSQAFPEPLISVAAGTRIALLLPLTGPASALGMTVRDGFLSAFYQLPTASRPALRVYDTAAEPATEALAQARAAGTTFIVGPLMRDDVIAVAALGAQSTPVLALNFLPADHPAPSGVYQFALSPEEEAQLVAQRILADGRHRGIVLVPRDDWGNRVASAFARALTTGGGSVIAQATYDPAGHDYGDALKNVLRIDDSEARHERLQRVLRTKLNFEPRHRGDIEFVFIVAETAVNARLMEPQLKYSYAGEIPSYSISNAYEPDSLDANRDISGLMYPDMPWMVSGEGSMDELRSSIGQAWSTRTPWRSRLFAFGYDACQLMLAMSAPQANPAYVQINGLTGQLHFDPDRRVERGLIWVRIDRDGAPKRLATVTDTD